MEKSKKSGGGFGAKDALEARAGELNADELFAVGAGIGDMNDAAVGGEVGFIVSRGREAIGISGAGIVAGVSNKAAIMHVTCRAGGSPRGVVRKWNTNFEIGADGQVKARDESGAVAAKIFAGGFFFEEDAAFIAATNLERQMDGDSTFRALPRYGRAHWDHGLGPRFC